MTKIQQQFYNLKCNKCNGEYTVCLPLYCSEYTKWLEKKLRSAIEVMKKYDNRYIDTWQEIDVNLNNKANLLYDIQNWLRDFNGGSK